MEPIAEVPELGPHPGLLLMFERIAASLESIDRSIERIAYSQTPSTAAMPSQVPPQLPSQAPSQMPSSAVADKKRKANFLYDNEAICAVFKKRVTEIAAALSLPGGAYARADVALKRFADAKNIPVSSSTLLSSNLSRAVLKYTEHPDSRIASVAKELIKKWREERRQERMKRRIAITPEEAASSGRELRRRVSNPSAGLAQPIL